MGTADTTTKLRQMLRLSKVEPALTMERIAELRSYPSGEAVRKFIARNRDHFAFMKRGRRVLVTLTDFDRGCERIEAERKTRKTA